MKIVLIGALLLLLVLVMLLILSAASAMPRRAGCIWVFIWIHLIVAAGWVMNLIGSAIASVIHAP